MGTHLQSYVSQNTPMKRCVIVSIAVRRSVSQPQRLPWKLLGHCPWIQLYGNEFPEKYQVLKCDGFEIEVARPYMKGGPIMAVDGSMW